MRGLCIRKVTSPTFGATSNHTKILGQIHTDLCGPIPTPSVGGARYILTFIDDVTCYTKAYFLKQKSETFTHFLEYKAFHERQTGKLIKVLWSDRGGKYINSDMHTYLTMNGIHHKTTMVDTPQ